ncbi:kinase-like protein [Microthyrium microscopicum]|uniref:Kinase-like protein n=1 Tax=Microthyrium microscopicum TaxID=703497 RepID=A0A6A6UC68_9PEZI|nr:kinase-like protein [Microthyrium microscopicum]
MSLSSQSLPDVKQRVATFEISAITPVESVSGAVQDTYYYQADVPIHADDEFYIGRGAHSCGANISDLTVSNRHIKVRCILFESEEANLPPIVYVTDLSTNGTFLTRSDSDTEERLPFRSHAILLREGDELRLGARTLCTFHIDGPATSSIALTELQQRESQLFRDRFIIENQAIGFGGQGAVYAARHIASSSQLACKVIPILHKAEGLKLEVLWDSENFTSQDLNRLSAQFREFVILAELDHPNIVGLNQVFWSQNNIYIFQELFTGGDLFSLMTHRKCDMDEVEVAAIILQVLMGLKYLHDRDIVHRDLKLENVLVTTVAAASARVVITDFGWARHIPKVQLSNGSVRMSRMTTYVGTPDWNAPEIRAGKNPMGYTKAVDLWAVGVMTCALLAGQPPGTDPDMICKYVENITTEPLWSEIGDRPKSFVRRLVTGDAHRRLTVDQALHHRWFTNSCNIGLYQRLYDSAIKSWHPRPDQVKIIEKLSTTHGRLKSTPLFNPNSLHRVESVWEQESQYFANTKKPRDHVSQGQGQESLLAGRGMAQRSIYSIPNTEESISDTEESDTDDESDEEVASNSTEQRRIIAEKALEKLSLEPQDAAFLLEDSILPPLADSLNTTPESSDVDYISTSPPVPVPAKRPAEPTYFNPNQLGLRDMHIPGLSSTVRRPKKRPRTELQFSVVDRSRRASERNQTHGDGFD